MLSQGATYTEHLAGNHIWLNIQVYSMLYTVPQNKFAGYLQRTKIQEII